MALGREKGPHHSKKSYVFMVFLLYLSHPDICKQAPQRGISVLLQELVRRVQCMVTESSADVTQQVLSAGSMSFTGQADTSEAKLWVQNLAQLHYLAHQGFLTLLTQLHLLVSPFAPPSARLDWTSSVPAGVQAACCA